MKRFLETSMTSIVALFIALFCASSALALKPAAPANLKVGPSYSNSQTATGVSASWIYNHATQANSFKIYQANSFTNKLSDFTMVKEFISTDTTAPYFYTDLNITKNGKYTFYVTAVVNNVESDPSRLEQIMVDFIPSIIITSTPIETAQINVPISYQPTITKVDPQEVVEYYLEKNSSGATIDKNTGLITWTPTQSGNYPFYLEVYGKTSHYAAYQQWNIQVRKCAVGATISGTVKDAKGALIDKGMVELMPMGKDSSHGRFNFYESTEIKAGAYQFANLDEGTYILVASGYDFYSGKGALDTITVACGQNYTYDLTVSKYNYKDYVSIVSYPDYKASKNVLYTYQIKAYAGPDTTSVINYSLNHAPAGATIDINTGLVSWTPTEKGYYEFEASAFLKDDKSVESRQSWDVYVSDCATPTTLTVNIKGITYDSLTMKIYGYLYPKEMIITDSTGFGKDTTGNGKRPYLRMYDAYIVNNQLVFENIEAGDYYLLVDVFAHNQQGYGKFLEYWYETGKTAKDAKLITVACGSSLAVDMTIPAIVAPTLKTVSGVVTDEVTTLPIQGATVVFYPMNSYKGGDYHAITDANGAYSVALPDDDKYLGMAMFWGDSVKGADPKYMPIFYNQKTNPAEAELIDLTGTIPSINFALKSTPVFANSISGLVLNETQTPMANAFAVAFLVETEANYTQYLYQAKQATCDANGLFTIENLIPGKYVVMAYDGKRGEYLPGYYRVDSSVAYDWKQATKLDVTTTSLTTGITMQLDKAKKFGGKGKIHGFVGKKKGHGKISEAILASDAIIGANVYLADANGMVYLAQVTDQTGAFTIDALPAGKYSVWADKVSFDAIKQDVTVDGTSTSTSSYVEMSSSVISGVEDNVTTIDEALVSPNPAYSSSNLTFSGYNGVAEISIINATGSSVVNATINTVTGLNNYSIDSNNLPSGSYVARINNEGRILFAPFIVVK